MSYELNEEAFETFVKYRASGERDKKGIKIPKLTSRAETILANKLRKVPLHVQQSMVNRAMENLWRDVYLPQNTLDYDTSDAPNRTTDTIAPESIAIIDSVQKEMPKHSHSKEVTVNKKLARNALANLKDMVGLKKGSDQDLEYKETWLNAALEHEKRQK